MTDEFRERISEDFGTPFTSTGGGANSDVPAIWDCAINGRGYMLDKAHPAFGGQSAYLGRMGIETIPLVRTQADPSTEPGASTANPEDLWGRSQSSWHKGAGQEYLDAADSDRNRYHTSMHINPWTRGQLSLHHSATQRRAATDTNMKALRVGPYLYWCENHDVFFTGDNFATNTNTSINVGEAVQNVLSMATDGYYVFAALGINGIHTTIRGASSSSHYSDLQADLVDFVKGRIMAAKGPSIYNVVAAGAAPTALFTTNAVDFKWIGFANGLTCIYAGGYSGNKSVIYRTAIKPDGTSLDAPVQAGELPDGEIIRSVYGYLGFLLIGTTQGVRMATPDAQGNLTLGALIDIGASVRDFEGDGQYVYFTWENADGTNTGIGRLDLTQINTTGAPAYATDLMAQQQQGQVSSVVTTAEGLRAFVVVGSGIYVEDTTTITAEGYLNTGKLNYGIPDKKIALRTSIAHKPLPASSYVTMGVTADSGNEIDIATNSVAGSTAPAAPMKVPEIAARQFDIQVRLKGAVVFEQFEFRAYPVSRRGRTILIPILLHDEVLDANEALRKVDVLSEYEFIQSLVGAENVVPYQEKGTAFSGFVDDADFQRENATTDNRWWNGTLLVKFKVLGD